jgi:hypothetical protein
MIGFGQSYYIGEAVSPKPIPQPILLEIEGIISSKLLQLEIEETKQEERSTYTIIPIITKAPRYGRAGKGYIYFYESASNTLLLKSEYEIGMLNMFLGFENPYFLIFDRIVRKQFTDLLKKIEQMDIPIRSVSVIKEQANNEDKYEKLLKIGKLRDAGILNEEEFQIEKKKILSDE